MSHYYCDKEWHDADIDADYLVQGLNLVPLAEVSGPLETFKVDRGAQAMFAACRQHAEVALHVMLQRYSIRARD